LNVAEVGASAAPGDCRPAARKPRRVQESESHFLGPDVSSFIAGFGGHGVRDKEPVVVVLVVVVVVGWVSTWPGEKPLAPAARVW